jgi:4-hydroxy-tetrahydrodipicolinate synthase
MKLTGAVPALGTPLGPNEDIDESSLRRWIDRCKRAGVGALFVNGSMGAFALLTDEAQERLVRAAVQEARDELPVIAGVGETGTRRAVARARRFAELGADLVSVLPPFYFFLSGDEAVRFYRQVAAAVPCRMLAYHNPATTKVRLNVRTLLAIAALPNVVGLKNSDDNPGDWKSFAEQLPDRDRFSFLVGSEFLVVDALGLGADGGISGLQSLVPEIAVELHRSFRNGEVGRALAIQRLLMDLYSIFRGGDIWGAFEAAGRHLGLFEKVTAHPYRSLEDGREVEFIHGVVDRATRTFAEMMAAAAAAR